MKYSVKSLNTRGHLTPERVRSGLRARPNLWQGLTAEALERQLESFQVGHFREVGVVWQALEERDDAIRAASSKRKKAVARHGWEVQPFSHLPANQQKAARRHQEALEYFYRHLTCTHALEENERGGFKLLVRQMMDAVGKRFAVHEMVWQPSANGLTAEFRFVPLWFFENTTGRLRFLAREHALEGEALEEGCWLVSVGDGLMIPCSVAYHYKSSPLSSWYNYCLKHGAPGLHGTTTATRNTSAWEDALGALEAVSESRTALTNTDVNFSKVDLSTEGWLPHPALIERLDRMIVALWRGGDLSTLSRGRYNSGAWTQQEEAYLLEEDDAEWITESLRRYVDPWVIRYACGDAEPLAGVRVKVCPPKAAKLDLEIDRFLLEAGFPLDMKSTLSRYCRPIPEDGSGMVRQSDDRGQPSAAQEPVAD